MPTKIQLQQPLLSIFPTAKSPQRKKPPNLFLLVLLLALFSLSTSINFAELSVTAESYIINTITKYTVFYDRTQENYGIAIDVTSYPVPAGSNVTLTLPSVYAVNSTIGLTAMVNGGAPQFPNFTLTFNTITVFNLFPTQTIVSNLTLVLSNILNPSPAIITDAFVGTIGLDYA